MLRVAVIAVSVLLVTAGVRWHDSSGGPIPALPAHGLSVTARVNVVSVPRAAEFGQYMVMQVSDPVSARRLQVFWPASNRVQRRDSAVCWYLTLQLTALAAQGNPGLPERAATLHARGIDGQAKVIDRASSRPCARQPWFSAVQLREHLGRQIRSAVSDDAASAVLVALATGDRQYLAPEQRELFARTGTAHVMAISGMHIGLVAGCCFMLMRWLLVGRTTHCEALALLASVLAGAGYAVLAGGALPTLRAVAMLALVAVFRLLRMRIDLLRLTCITAAVFVVLRTAIVTTPSFILSFAAVAALGVVQRRAHASHGHTTATRLPVLRAQAILSVALLPLVSVLFGQVSVMSLGVNLLILPVFAFAILPLLLIGIVISPGSEFAASELWQLAALLCRWLLDGLAVLLQWLPGWVATTGLSTTEALVACGMLMAAVLLAGWPARGLLLLAAPIALMARSQTQASGCVTAHVLSVGHGTAIVLAGAHTRWLYDTGPLWRSGASAAQHIVMPYLQRHWGGDFTRAIVSHSDNDHDGGVDALRQQGRVHAWLGLPASACIAGQRWQREGVRFEVLWPVAGALSMDESDNNASCVLRISAYKQTLILFGDVERAAERELVSMGGLAAIVTTMPHHGSNSSSTKALIASVAPNAVIASAGTRRGWQLPHPAVEHRWRDGAAQVYVTHRHGAVRVKLCRDATQVVTGVASL